MYYSNKHVRDQLADLDTIYIKNLNIKNIRFLNKILKNRKIKLQFDKDTYINSDTETRVLMLKNST